MLVNYCDFPIGEFLPPKHGNPENIVLMYFVTSISLF